MKVPFGTWTAETSPEKAKSRPAYSRNGRKSEEWRRSQAPPTMNGASRIPPTRTLKIVTAWRKPVIRLAISGPIPWPKKLARVGVPVMLFSSPIERIHRIRPEDDDGDRLPKTASSVSYTHLRAHETDSYLVCRL